MAEPDGDAGGRRGVAAFDVDGTLVPGDSLGPFLASLVGRSRLARATCAALPALAAAYRRAGRSGAKEVLLARTVSGLDAAAVAAAGHRFGLDMAGRVRPDMAERLSWHRQQGHLVVLVSASLTCYLEPLGEALAVDGVVATRLEEGPGGTLTGRLVGANVRGPEKARRLAQWLATAAGTAEVELWAYGDSPGDRDLLAMADHPTMVGRRGTAGRGTTGRGTTGRRSAPGRAGRSARLSA